MTYVPGKTEHQQFTQEIKKILEKQKDGKWIKTYQLIKKLCGDTQKGWRSWSHTHTRRVLYDLNSVDKMPDWLETKEEPGRGDKDNIYWRLKLNDE